MKHKILLVEDDRSLGESIKVLLEEADYNVSLADDFYAAENYIYKDFNGENSIDLYIFDIMLGKENGFSLCRKVREKKNTPIIFLSALDDEEHVIEGLNFGADDYIAKPFRKRELLARVSANIRRKLREQDKKIIKSGELSFVTAEERLFSGGREIELRKTELELFKYMIQSNGRLIRREQLLEYLWDSAGVDVEDNTLSVHMSRLRKKIGKTAEGEYIETVRGIGYRWKVQISEMGEI